MDIWDFGLGAVALGCTVVMAIIPLRHDIYDKIGKRYTKPGKWFIGLAIVALASGITLQARSYLEGVESDNKNDLERRALHRQIDSLGQHLDSLANLRQRNLDQYAQARLIKRINDSLAAHGLTKTSEITIAFTQGNEEAMNFALEVAKFLAFQGYTINRTIGRTMGNEGKGFWITYDNGKMFIDVGIASHK